MHIKDVTLVNATFIYNMSPIYLISRGNLY